MDRGTDHDPVAPMSQAALLALDNTCPAEDRRPFGKATPSSRSFWLDRGNGGGDAVDLIRSSLADGAYELATAGTVNFGLPLQSLTEGATASTRGRRRSPTTVDPHVPDGIPIAYHPKIATAAKRTVGRLAGGGKMLLGQEPHATIINGESRQFVYPDAYPYSSICKLHVEAQDRPGGAWGDRSHAPPAFWSVGTR